MREKTDGACLGFQQGRGVFSGDQPFSSGGTRGALPGSGTPPPLFRHERAVVHPDPSTKIAWKDPTRTVSDSMNLINLDIRMLRP